MWIGIPILRWRTNFAVVPPVVLADVGGGGGALRMRRHDEMSVEQWRLRNKRIKEDEIAMQQSIELFLGEMQK